ncbi:TadE/TadG family type IV pilus assembly protein [Micromonosporaceae bacterium Da 78-11]
MPAASSTPSSPEPAVERPARGESGAAAVELAIVLPTMLLLIFGLIDFGRVMQQQIQLTEAVREGARVGALSGTIADVKTQVSGVVGSDVTVTYTTVAACSSASAAGADAIVVATRPFAAITPVFAVMQMFSASSGTITLRGVGVMSCIG